VQHKNRLDDALLSLTEPHRLQQLLGTVAACALPIVRDNCIEGLPDVPVTAAAVDKTAGRKNRRSKSVEVEVKSLRLYVIPLLNTLLPALDPNDISKATVAFQVQL
jgi:hypothetical protein